MSQNRSYFKYWGKTSKPKDNGKEINDAPVRYHLLVYHCLDVAAVASEWWNNSPSLRRQFCQLTGLSEEETKAWLLFFIAIHDLGKLAILFQLKSKSAWQLINPELAKITTKISESYIKEYNHGFATVYWLYQDNETRFFVEDDEDGMLGDDNESWQAWFSWVSAVAGHHGIIPEDFCKDKLAGMSGISNELLEEFKQDRLYLLQALEQLFLKPAGLNLANDPPKLTEETMLAGFCSVCDWIGSCSDEGAFEYQQQLPKDNNLLPYFTSRLSIAKTLLIDFGLIGAGINNNANISALLEESYSPRPMQQLIAKLPIEIGITIIEATTGSGKTEAALLYAWMLLENNLADSIVFALPTQATANCMLERIEKIASKIFKNNINTVLAHGRAKHQQKFIDIKNATKPNTAQNEEEALVQCANWLAESKKRVFLGQIGICTIDQVLVSVLPIKHKFVRGFGVGRSVLIIDEVHAYDQYMYGLLEEVLQQQQQSYSSTILLSATLPEYQKQQLMNCWDKRYKNKKNISLKKIPYPLINFCSNNQAKTFSLNNLDNPVTEKTTSVKIELQKSTNLFPDDELLDRIIDAATKGVRVAIVCNLVDVAQKVFAKLRIRANTKLSDEQFILFHSRYTFNDRQKIESKVLEIFGKGSVRDKGYILVSTQVFECSIDADVDWMITQLCPVDLLFQRLGRLHRHYILRLLGFEKPLCTILIPQDIEYKSHELIYGSARILWRTQQLLETSNNIINFPVAYREWIEAVYQQDNWGNEPDAIIKSHKEFIIEQEVQRCKARYMVLRKINAFTDTDSNVAVLTRDSEMSLTVVPKVINHNGSEVLLDGTLISSLQGKNNKSFKFEKLSLNSVTVPSYWNLSTSAGQSLQEDEHEYIWLTMNKTTTGYQCTYQQTTYNYSTSLGFSRTK
jgi:CRISPR-associated endonuclease/helicase Cas3